VVNRLLLRHFLQRQIDRREFWTNENLARPPPKKEEGGHIKTEVLGTKSQLSLLDTMKIASNYILISLLSWFLFGSSFAVAADTETVTTLSQSPQHLRGANRRMLEESSVDWRARVKEKGEALFAEKKRAAIRAACYKDWYGQLFPSLLSCNGLLVSFTYFFSCISNLIEKKGNLDVEELWSGPRKQVELKAQNNKNSLISPARCLPMQRRMES
jgi:hypothetical protein